MSKTKIIAMYLPQYHCIPENDEFWGEGFTDWVTVKKAKLLFEGHRQPKVPLNENYYDLSKKENVAWQAKLAKEHGIYGFGIYHYWFNNEKNILTKPVEIIHENKNIDINYFLAWDNGNWVRSWSNVSGNAWSPLADKKDTKHKGPAILIPYILGTEADWENHYNVVRQQFHDQRYIKNGNKPVFMVLKYDSEIAKMCSYWDELAKKDGFDGMYFIYRYNKRAKYASNDNTFYYEPLQHSWRSSVLKLAFHRLYKKIFHEYRFRVYNYDDIWRKIIRDARNISPNIYPGAFVAYDDTPRRGKNGTVIKGGTPQKFKEYMSELLSVSEKNGKDYIFLTAWNEWGEGAYMEPDSDNAYAYLKALKEALKL